MKAVVLLALLVFALVLVPETDAWGRRFFRRVGRFVRRVARRRLVKIVVRHAIRKFGKRDADMSEEDFLHHLATRDITDLVDVDKLTDAELEDLLNVQRETREALNEGENEDSQQAEKLH